MKPSRNRPDPQSGQALPLAIACLFSVTLLIAFCLRSGERLIQRERVRARADLTAFSGGISYARSLNIFSLSQKANAAAWLATLFTGGGAFKSVQEIQKVQTAALKYGPWISEASVIGIGFENGILAIPVWNRPVLFKDAGLRNGRLQGFDINALSPSYNIKSYSLSDGAADLVRLGAEKALPDIENPFAKAGVGKALDEGVSRSLEQVNDAWAEDEFRALREGAKKAAKRWLPGADLDWLLETDHYEYRRRKDGVVVRVDPKDARVSNESDGRGGRIDRDKATARLGNKYLSAVDKLNLALQIGWSDGGNHVITLIAIQAPRDGAGEARPGWVSAISQVQVAGGSMDFTDPDSAAYAPTFVPVRLFKDIRFSKAGGSLHGINGDIGLPWGPGNWDRKIDAAGLGASLPGAIEAMPLPPAIKSSALRVLNAAGDILAVQH